MWAVPLVGAFCGVATIVVCYHLTAANGHLPPGVSTPPISFLGAKDPEHTAYQLGFAVTGVALAACMHLWSVIVHPILLNAGYGSCASYGLWGGWAACVGATGQGLITFEENIVAKIAESNPQISAQSMWHQLIAAGFFMGAAAHCYSMTYAVWSSPSPALQRFVCLPSKLVKTVICVGTFVASPIAQALHPAARQGSGSDNASFAVAGLAQYLTGEPPAVQHILCFAHAVSESASSAHTVFKLLLTLPRPAPVLLLQLGCTFSSLAAIPSTSPCFE